MAELALLALAALTGLASQGPNTTSVIVPAIGNVIGLGGVRWVTSLDLRNDTGSDADVWLLLPATSDAQAFNISLARGQQVSFRDVVAEAFGTDTALSPLQVITSGNRSVSIGVTAYAVRPDGSVASEPVPIDYIATWAPFRALHDLSFSDDFRTNVGLVNMSEDQPASFTLAVQRIAGRSIAIAHITLPPVSILHAPIQTIFPSITKGNDFTVVIEGGGSDTYVYASVVDNVSSEARFIRPAIAGSIGEFEPEP